MDLTHLGGYYNIDKMYWVESGLAEGLDPSLEMSHITGLVRVLSRFPIYRTYDGLEAL